MKASKHIVIDACCLGRRKTGNETYIRGLLKGLEEIRETWKEDGEKGLRFTILTTEAHQGQRSDCFEWVNIPLGNFLTRNFLTIPRLLKELKAELYHASYWSRFWAQPCPTILMVHDLSFVSFPEGFHRHEQFIYANLVRMCARNAAHLLTVSEFSKTELMTHWGIPADKITVTYDGIDEIFRPAEKNATGGSVIHDDQSLPSDPQPDGARQSAESSLKGESSSHSAIKNPKLQFQHPPYLLYVGNLHPRKNLVRLLEAFVLLKKEHNVPHVLKIVGQKAWLAGEIFAAVRESGLEKAVEFTGYVEQSQLVSLYQQAALTVYPSLYEGFGLPPMEAMACGCPVVTSNSTSLPEVTGGRACLVDPTSVMDITRGMAEVLEDSERCRQMAEQGPERAKEFTWRDCAEATLSVYRSTWKTRS